MSTLGIIAEYNPFHNGHLYHLQKSKELSSADYSIAVMGGNFLQRGEPALWNKWTRTKMALLAGIDLVIELPFVFASQDSHGFAQAGIRLLDSLGVVDYIAFGCENEQIETFVNLAKLIRTEPPYFKKVIKEGVKKGDSFPKIREKAITSFYQKYAKNLPNTSLDEVREFLNKSNNILALEYIIALQDLKSSIKPIPIKRIGSRYLEDNLEGQYSSATAIRKIIAQSYYSDINNANLLERLKSTIPDSSYQIIREEFQNGFNPILLSCFEQSIFSKLRSMDIADIKKINGIQEGLENKLKKAAISTGSIEDLLIAVKSKRYTHTRIQRILIHSLIGLTKREVQKFNRCGPLYCRVLGMTKKGRLILKKAKSNSKLPLVLKLSNFYQQHKKLENEVILKMLDYDILATNLYVLAYKSVIARAGGQDFINKIILI
jgi:predicted nucleotidyltransferase